VRVERQGKDGRWREVDDVRMPLKASRFSKAIRLRAPGLYRLTPRTGTGRTAHTAPQVYVRAVRSARASFVRMASSTASAARRPVIERCGVTPPMGPWSGLLVIS